MNETRFFGMLGFAMRAGKLVIGTELICRTMQKKNEIKLLLISDGASEATKKKLKTKSEFYGIESITVSVPMEKLGTQIGKTFSPAGIAITDSGFAVQIREALKTQP